jgi:hypothetical protein
MDVSYVISLWFAKVVHDVHDVQWTRKYERDFVVFSVIILNKPGGTEKCQVTCNQNIQSFSRIRTGYLSIMCPIYPSSVTFSRVGARENNK